MEGVHPSLSRTLQSNLEVPLWRVVRFDVSNEYLRDVLFIFGYANTINLKINMLLGSHFFPDRDDEIHEIRERPFPEENTSIYAFTICKSIDDFLSRKIHGRPIEIVSTGTTLHINFRNSKLYDPLSFYLSDLIDECKYNGIISDNIIYSGYMNTDGTDLGREAIDRPKDEDLDLARQLYEFYRLENMSDAEALRLAFRFIESDPPILGVLNATKQLRADFRRGTGKQIGTERAPYPGRRQGIDPIKFLKEEYSAELAAGTLGPGQLSVADQKLYTALRDAPRDVELLDRHFKDGIRPSTVKEIIDLLSKGTEAEFGPEKRAESLGTILSASEDEAMRYFSRNRPERMKARSGGARST